MDVNKPVHHFWHFKNKVKFWLTFPEWNATVICLFFLSLSQLDVGDLKQQLAHSQTLFPENPSVWFKDLAGYLNLYLTAPDTGPTLSSYTYGRSIPAGFLTLCTFYPVLTTCQGWFQVWRCDCLFVSRLSILPDRKGAERDYQGFNRALQCHSARFIRLLCLYDAQGTGQTVR